MTASYHLKAGDDRLRVRRNIRIDMKRDEEALVKPVSIFAEESKAVWCHEEASVENRT